MESDYFGLDGLSEAIRNEQLPEHSADPVDDDDKTREHILVFTSDKFDNTRKKPWGTLIADRLHNMWGYFSENYKCTSNDSISGPIVKLKFDESWERYEFQPSSICKIRNATGATHPWYGECTWGDDKEFGTSWLEKDFKNLDFKKGRSVWFACPEQHTYPPLSMLMDVEAKILDKWDHYWESAEDILESDTLPKSIRFCKCFR